MTTTHLFGEMDLDLSQDVDKIYKECFRISEQCGYMPDWDAKNKILNIYGSDYERVKIYFDKTKKVIKVERSEDDGENWEQLNFKDGLFDVTPEVLKNYNSKITYGTQKKLPMSQGCMLNEIVAKYKITNAIKWGYHFDILGIETPKQFLLWKDCGSYAQHLGIIDKNEVIAK